MIPKDPDDLDVLAGEYVLGLLDAATTDEVEQARPTHPVLARRIAFWETRLLPATQAIAAADVAPDLWNRIARDLPAAGPRDGAVRAPVWRRTWNDARFWRGTTALATAASLALALLPVRNAQSPGVAPRFFAILQSRDATGQDVGPGWVIQVARDGTVRSLPLADVYPGQGHSLQLWTLWDPTRGPVSLGILPPGGAVRLPPERLEAINAGQLFEITLEPETGSPTGRPTGRVLFIGRARGTETQAL